MSPGHDHAHHHGLSDGALMQRTAWAAIGVTLFLILLKLGAYLVSDSIAMLASLADGALDLFASAINLLAIRHALTPADHDHRFGHGKAEPLAGLMQAAFIAGSVVFLAIESVSRLIQPHPIENSAVAFWVMGISIAVVLGLVSLQAIAVRRTGSVAIAANRLHYLADLLTNAGVVVGLVLSSMFGWLQADPIIGLIICGVLALSSFAVFRQSYDQLMDKELPPAERERIKAIVLEHKDVHAIHDLRTRMAGVITFIQMHLELDPDMSLIHAHEVSDAVEAAVLAAFPKAEVMIHQDPAGVEMLPELVRG